LIGRNFNYSESRILIYFGAQLFFITVIAGNGQLCGQWATLLSLFDFFKAMRAALRGQCAHHQGNGQHFSPKPRVLPIANNYCNSNTA
jgi:hypothetical protein